MTTTQEIIDLTQAAPAEAAAPAPVSAAASGDPSVLGLPVFIVGSTALGLNLTGILNAGAGASIIPIVMLSTGLGLLIVTLWAAALGQTAVAGIFGVFSGFWLSYGVLVLGLNHNWFNIPAEDVTSAVGGFLFCWTVIVTLLTLVTMRLPLAFTVLIGMVAAALAIVTIATYNTMPNLTKFGGWVVFAFALLGAYLYASASAASLGGPGYPLGKPLQK